MKFYSVAEIEITDQSWVPEYVKNVTRLVEQRGGRYLVRTSKVEKIEGERNVPQVFLIIEWPSRDVYSSITYGKPLSQLLGESSSCSIRTARRSRRDSCQRVLTKADSLVRYMIL